ncbi:SDR family NAD(P)-dependent oxidoreductase [Pseudobacteriovorax antillogorgiicola]|uniref:NAD(P)-dependent dehydrogenase, short-chain alcohol dehydrogenase family n=1 Tax=Pseudobacteriovorax antillogorgiicola TaxID=1513793 RepID=A0A1Y6BHS6_9BACT|nr:SDR family NAD(P)-dependent oxidoreductase [Pseudobacteriovorax antillogorgiicola]TCS56238.1 NAD(P)-dependent dehydrogenase (short-subunit alcohol dehydrogenase family) [Pseudobacteriovorax antillogorgiicola]SMF08164.1 NAD(P)-dependent dehydrogenase, short-chain alcohol dehydrogenase family [Pseudobacteriovorax antillogorgiicola]
MNKFNLPKIHSTLIIGAGHGIGLSLVESLLDRAPEARIFASYRDATRSNKLMALAKQFSSRLKTYQWDPNSENNYKSFAEKIEAETQHIDLLINSIGFLHNSEFKPEKSLRDVNMDQLMESFRVNSVVTPLLARYFFHLLRHDQQSCFASISAKVGSIEDNQLGGWYGYRASKAALNMFLKNISLEFKRRNCNTSVLSIHPGTTITELSEPFIARTKLKLHKPEETATNILNVIDREAATGSGKFFSWDGKELPW